jgi:hypothetical protein
LPSCSSPACPGPGGRRDVRRELGRAVRDLGSRDRFP